MLQPVAALKEAWNAESQSQVVPVSARESKESRLPTDFPMIREDSEPEDVKVVPAKTVKPKAKAKQTPRRRIRGKTSPEAVNKMYGDVQKKLMQFDQGLVDSLNMQVVVGGKSKKVPAKKRTKQEKQKQEQLVAVSGQKNAKTAGRASSAVSEARGRSPVQEDEEEQLAVIFSWGMKQTRVWNIASSTLVFEAVGNIGPIKGTFRSESCLTAFSILNHSNHSNDSSFECVHIC